MAKKKTSKAVGLSSGQKMSPVIQFAVVFIIIAAIVLAYYVGSMR
jgi:hypothetical protein